MSSSTPPLMDLWREYVEASSDLRQGQRSGRIGFNEQEAIERVDQAAAALEATLQATDARVERLEGLLRRLSGYIIPTRDRLIKRPVLDDHAKAGLCGQLATWRDLIAEVLP